MSESPEYHIILLPRENYWTWVNAIRDYAVRFGVSVTPHPENAVRFHRPMQVISVANLSGGYPEHGDIVKWLETQAPEVPLDVLDAATPDQLHQLLAERIQTDLRFGPVGSPAVGEPSGLRLLWPVDSPVIVQEFGQNPAVYRRWGLPGHDGVDFRAPINSSVYACADGEVYRVHDGSGGHPYGIHVRIRHTGGYKTIYAHLNQALVHSGQEVNAGDLIGLSDGTGNTSGHFLHLTLKKEGATADGLTDYPNDIIDPTPYLVFPDDREPLGLTPGVWPYDHCLVGLHGRADGPMQDADWEPVRTARVEALKLTSSASSADVERARRVNPDMFVMVRLFADFQHRVVTPSEFARWVGPDMQRFYERGVRYFEVHNEPNLTPEGYGTSWRDGHEFGQWFLSVVGGLKPKFPEARFGWPGISPGPTVSGMRFDHLAFLESADRLVAQADWIGCHCHWHDEDAMLSLDGGLGYQFYRDTWPDKLLLITEFSNPAPDVDWFTKANQYVKYYRHLRDRPGVGAAFAFVVSASANYPYETWRDESGQSTPVAGVIGSRSF
jgi:murein DD-endopeptidase MepM/ murein hydrolase activator NlpD